MSIEKLRRFLGWCTVINFGLFFFGVIELLLIAEWASEIHADGRAWYRWTDYSSCDDLSNPAGGPRP